MKILEGARYSYRAGDTVFKIIIPATQVIRQFNFVTTQGATIDNIVPNFIESEDKNKVYEFSTKLETKAEKFLKAIVPNSILCIIEGTAIISRYDSKYHLASLVRILSST